MKNMIDYFSLICGRAGLLFVAGGLFVMAADYVHSFTHEENNAAVNAVVCMRLGTCEAS